MFDVFHFRANQGVMIVVVMSLFIAEGEERKTLM